MHGCGVAHLLALLSHLSFSSFLSLSSHPAPAAAPSCRAPPTALLGDLELRHGPKPPSKRVAASPWASAGNRAS